MKIYETKVEAGTKQWLKIPVDEECSLKSGGFLWFKTGKTVDCYSGGTWL